MGRVRRATQAALVRRACILVYVCRRRNANWASGWDVVELRMRVMYLTYELNSMLALKDVGIEAYGGAFLSQSHSFKG